MPDSPRRPVSSRRAAPARARRAVVVLGLLAGLVAGCSSTPDPEAATPDEAAQVVTSGFELDDAAHDCLRDAFETTDGAAAALTLGGSAPERQRTALTGVLDRCVTAEAFADITARSVAEGVAGTTRDQQACVHQAVLDLPAERRTTLMVGLALSGDAQPDDLDVEVGEITQDLFDACDVTLDVGATTTTTG